MTMSTQRSVTSATEDLADPVCTFRDVARGPISSVQTALALPIVDGREAELPDLAAMMNPASRELLGNDRSTSETGPRSDEAMDGAQFRNLVDFLGRPTTIDRCVDAMGQQATSPAIGLFAARSTEHPSCGSRHTRVDGTQGIG
jgi:hypothetical protein